MVPSQQGFLLNVCQEQTSSKPGLLALHSKKIRTLPSYGQDNDRQWKSSAEQTWEPKSSSQPRLNYSAKSTGCHPPACQRHLRPPSTDHQRHHRHDAQHQRSSHAQPACPATSHRKSRRTADSLDQVEVAEDLKQVNGQQFLGRDVPVKQDRILLFSTEEYLQKLHEAPYWIKDGTF